MLSPLLMIALGARAKSEIAPFPDFAGVKPFYIARTGFFRTDEERNRGRTLNFGVSLRTFLDTEDKVCLRIYGGSVPHIKEERPEQLAVRLLRYVDGCVSSTPGALSRLGRAWLFADAVCAWRLANVRYDFVLSQKSPGEVIRTQDTETILGMDRPSQVCSGISNVIRDVANAAPAELGIRCDRVGGWFRDMGKETPKVTNHAWNLFDFGGGIRVPADAALGVDPNWLKGQKGKGNRGWILPTYRETWEFFLAGHHGAIRPKGKENDDVYRESLIDPLTGLTYRQWADQPTNDLVQMERFIRNDSVWR